MARKRKDTFFHDMATGAMLKVLVQLSQEGLTPGVGVGCFPAFQVYPSKLDDSDLMCDLACVLTPRQPAEEKRAMAEEIIRRLGNVWAVSPFDRLTVTGNGVICLRIPPSATKR